MAAVDIENLPRTRKEALAIGSRHYFSDKPCPKGHINHPLIIAKSFSNVA